MPQNRNPPRKHVGKQRRSKKQKSRNIHNKASNPNLHQERSEESLRDNHDLVIRVPPADHVLETQLGVNYIGSTEGRWGKWLVKHNTRLVRRDSEFGEGEIYKPNDKRVVEQIPHLKIVLSQVHTLSAAFKVGVSWSNIYMTLEQWFLTSCTCTSTGAHCCANLST